MQKEIALALLLSLGLSFSSLAGEIRTDNVVISVRPQYDSVRPGSKSALAVDFDLAEDWHFYASDVTKLTIKASSEDYIVFSEPVFPPSQVYEFELAGQKQQIPVYSNSFTVYLPFEVGDVSVGPRPRREAGAGESVDTEFEIGIEGAMCSGSVCIMPDFEPLKTVIKVTTNAPMTEPAFELAETAWSKPEQKTALVKTAGWVDYSVWVALPLAFLAGLILNIMPCVLPVIPLIVLNIFDRAKDSRVRSVSMGLAFCAGILLFFAALAVVNIVLRVGYNQVFQWGDHYRNPVFLAGLSLLMILLALFMFGVVTFTLPSSVSGKSKSAEGLGSSVTIGFFAAILSTPCSFAILAAVFAWAQTQRLFLATVTIMVIGFGMAAPYAILTSVPSLLKYIPKPGRWMELFKQSMGFVLLGIAVKLIASLPEQVIPRVSLFSVIFSFCVWMWGGWVTLATPRVKKYIIRAIAVVIVILSAVTLLTPSKNLIDWQEYDPVLVKNAIKENRPVLIKFTADWCLTCKALDLTTYSSKGIARLIKKKNVLPLKGDTTERGSQAEIDLKNVYNEPVPVSILYIPGQAEPERMRGFEITRLQGLLRSLGDVERASDEESEG